MRACAEEPDLYRQIWNVPADLERTGRFGTYRQICNLPECSAGLQIRLNDEPIRLNNVCKSVLLSYFYFENNTEPYDVEN